MFSAAGCFFDRPQVQIEKIPIGPGIPLGIEQVANHRLKAKHLQKDGIHLLTPWLLSEFGHVSAASNMIAFLRQLASLNPGNHILFDGFGAGAYYDVVVVALGG